MGEQNLIEACACDCPVVMGPHTFNFKQAAEWAMKAQAGVRCSDMVDGMAQALAIALDRPRQQSMSQAAQLFASSHRGAVARCVKALAACLDKP